MKSALNEILKTISDSGNPIISKLITYFGLSVGVGGGTVQAIADKSSNQFVQECAAATPEFLSYAPAVGVASLVIKNICDVYFRRKELKIKERDSED